MAELRRLALACCILCALAGIVRIFWPENRYKSVINAAMMLYILSAGLFYAKDTDWRAVFLSLDAVTVPEPIITQEYLTQITTEATSLALQNALLNAGIDATVTETDGSYIVNLQDPADEEKATDILQQNGDDLAFQLQEDGAMQ